MTEKRTNLCSRLIFAAVVWLCVLGLAGCELSKGPLNNPEAVTAAVEEAGIKVHFLDVGQGDSELVEADGHFMLIDAGEGDQGEKVISYLKGQGVRKLDYVIGTHPHSDHIGGLEAVIREFDIGTVILPEKEHTTGTYERLLEAIEEKNLKVRAARAGDSYELGAAAFQILSPARSYGDELNNWSVGIRLTYGDNAFILCGDAEKEAEADMCQSGLELKADVLKVSHHGSRTSSSEEFLDRVAPKTAVISCGRDNDYGHPHEETLEKLKERGIWVLRTDLLGTIVAQGDGKNLQFVYAEAEEALPSSEARTDYVVNENTRKFHLPDCRSVTAMKKENRREYHKTRQELIQMGYEPCGSCQP